MMARARSSLRQAVLETPFGTDPKKIYFDWYEEFSASLADNT